MNGEAGGWSKNAKRSRRRGEVNGARGWSCDPEKRHGARCSGSQCLFTSSLAISQRFLGPQFQRDSSRRSTIRPCNQQETASAARADESQSERGIHQLNSTTRGPELANPGIQRHVLGCQSLRIRREQLSTWHSRDGDTGPCCPHAVALRL